MILDPPARYDLPFVGPPVVESVLDAMEVDHLCRQGGAKAVGQIIGCSFTLGRYCFIILSEDSAVLRRHEIAHCNGWRHN